MAPSRGYLATEAGVLAGASAADHDGQGPFEPGTRRHSALGTLATLAGGLAIGLAALLYLLLDGALGGGGLRAAGGTTLALVAAGALGGAAGSLIDSLLGATVQAIYYTRGRNKETEKPIDPDGTPNELVRGWRWLNNDWVNFLSSCAGAAAGAGVYFALVR